MRVKQRRKNTVAANRTIALITMAMMLASIFSFTALANNGDATNVPEVETVDGYVTNGKESSADAVLGGEEALELEASEPNAPAFNDNAEIPDGNTYNQEEDLLYGGESANDHEYYGEETEALSDFVVADWDALYDVFKNLMTTNGPYTVNVVDSITMEAQLNISTGRIVNLTGGGVLYQPTANARHFAVDGTLMLNDIAITGIGTAAIRGGVLVNTTGYLYLLNGGTINGNTAENGAGVHNFGVFTMDGGTISGNRAQRSGGGVHNYGTFTMTDGAIAQNSALGWGGWTRSNNGSGGGGGVYNNGMFTMYGGSIDRNDGEGAGVSNVNTFIMNDGFINNNSSNIGGGVSIFDNGEFIMNGGSITRNGARLGNGGVDVSFGTFIMHGGEISRNSAGHGNGGVSVSRHGIFTMHGGEINENRATGSGGGIGNSGHFTMYGGSINGNSVSGAGGEEQAGGQQHQFGAGVSNGGVFTMNGGVISGNIVRNMTTFYGRLVTGVGGGVSNGGTFTMNAGTITGNTAVHGGGVHNTGAFTMSGGRINDNIADESDGRVRVGVHFTDSGTPSMTGGYIANNTDVEVSAVYGTQIRIANVPTLERFGYNFAGWLLGEELLTSAEVAEIIVDEPMTFVAQWTRNPNYWFTVTFAPGTQGVFTEQVFTDILLGAATPTFVGTPTGTDGWSFTRWSPEIAETVTANVTFVAQWEEATQTISDPEYRTIRIYYYLEGYGHLVNDLVNNAVGREYVREAGSTFNLAHVVDRSELVSDESYMFKGWKVYIDDVHDNSYIADINSTQLRSSFTVPTSIDNDAGVIRLVAVWSIYEVYEGGNGGDNGNSDTALPTQPPSDQQKLPQTGIVSNMLLWSALLVLVIIVGVDSGMKTKNIRSKVDSGK